MSLILVGCSGEDVTERNRAERHNYEILFTYDYDQVRPVIEEDKSVNEIWKDMQLESLGILESDTVFPKQGIDEENGVFVMAGVQDGDGIPELPYLTESDVNSGKEMSDVFAERRKEELSELLKQRQEVIKKNETKLTEQEEKNKVAFENEVKKQKENAEKAAKKKEDMIKKGEWKE